MLNFLKYVLATLVGLFLFGFLGLVVLIGIAAAAGGAETTDIASNAVLYLKLDKPINERASENPFVNLPFAGAASVPDALGLDELKTMINRAKTDDDVQGIYLDAEMVQAGMGTLQELRAVLEDFKTSGKWIAAYNEVCSEKSYYLVSVATKTWLHPQGSLEFNGLASTTTFFKHALDRLGIKPYIFRVGTYKSAVEPFFLDKMSDASREQTRSFLTSLNDALLAQVADSRKIDPGQLRHVQDSMLVHNADDAVRYGLMDHVGYYDEALDWMKKQTGKKRTEKLNLVTLDTYQSSMSDTETGTGSERIAVIYAEGDIVTGRGSADNIGSDKYAAALRDARLDDKVKAVVLRINSPGGSALASDVMWREVQLLKKAGKPVIASMSDVAASGGYYLAMGCDSIVAQPMTITGSIGVFGLLANLAPFLDDKLGLTEDRVTTGRFSDIPTVTRELTPYEQQQIQQEVNRIYADFTTKAAKGRHMPVDQLREVASGRVWSGTEARQRGLVDRFGSLEDAIAMAARRANLSEDGYRLKKLPARKSYYENLLSTLAGEDARVSTIRRELGALAPYYEQLQRLAHLENGVQARMPFELEVQ